MKFFALAALIANAAAQNIAAFGANCEGGVECTEAGTCCGTATPDEDSTAPAGETRKVCNYENEAKWVDDSDDEMTYDFVCDDSVKLIASTSIALTAAYFM